MVKQCIVDLPTSCGTTTSRGATQTTPDPLLVDSRTKNLTPKSVTLPSFTWVQLSEQLGAHRVYRWNDGNPRPRTGIQPRTPQTYHYGLVKFNGESLSISVMEHKAWLPISMLLQVKSFVRLVAIQELRSILPLMSASWLRVNRMPKNGIWLPIASIRINPNL